jgi:quercetin dioxygenase-like cupin family protein
MTVEDETRAVKAGSTVYVGPCQKHVLKAIGDRPLETFLAVMPSHELTHTFYNPDGQTYNRNRQPSR